MKKVDVIIRYEHKVRELESIMLLKLEMERRGYTVAFIANYDYRSKEKYNPRLIISPAIYKDSQLCIDIARFGLKKKIVNLLWEQLMGIEEEGSPTGAHNVIGTGQKAVTFCWGENTRRRLVAAGMPLSNAKVVGQINTDLLREPFRKILATKEQLAERFKIDVGSRWFLFVSSFAYCELDIIQKEIIRRENGEKYLEEFTNISIESRNEILKWLEKALVQYPKDVIIYRPHPDEMAKSEELRSLSSKYDNFYVIADLSLKQWCNAADKVYNWYSTGMIDALVLNKPCRILRPFHIPRTYDYRIFYTASHIKTIQDFIDDYESLDTTEGVDMNLVHDYYYIPKRYVYLEICDLLEEMLNTDKYDIHYTAEEKNRFRKVYYRAELQRKLGFCKPLLRKLGLFKDTFAKSDVTHKALDDGFAKNVATEEEIQEIYNRLKPIVYEQSNCVD